jgi:hypothetical protein
VDIEEDGHLLTRRLKNRKQAAETRLPDALEPVGTDEVQTESPTDTKSELLNI